jgi:hypothetical protein
MYLYSISTLFGLCVHPKLHSQAPSDYTEGPPVATPVGSPSATHINHTRVNRLLSPMQSDLMETVHQITCCWLVYACVKFEVLMKIKSSAVCGPCQAVNIYRCCEGSGCLPLQGLSSPFLELFTNWHHVPEDLIFKGCMYLNVRQWSEKWEVVVYGDKYGMCYEVNK